MPIMEQDLGISYVPTYIPLFLFAPLYTHCNLLGCRCRHSKEMELDNKAVQISHTPLPPKPRRKFKGLQRIISEPPKPV